MSERKQDGQREREREKEKERESEQQCGYFLLTRFAANGYRVCSRCQLDDIADIATETIRQQYIVTA
jgi:hypothetical protein